MTGLEHDKFLDLKGLECPIPVVKAREEINRMTVGEVLKVFATDSGSIRNFQGWAQAAKNILLAAQGFEGTDDDGFYIHYIRKIQ
jgi:tRNA 2-thiouridine synthesizing protein A